MAKETLSIDSHYKENVENKINATTQDGVQRSAIYSAESAETKKKVAEKQSGNMLITKISTSTPTGKPVNIDIERYRLRDQSVAANNATSLSTSSLSDEKGSKHTNNAPASPSVDDVSAAVKTKTENETMAFLAEGPRSVINNDATSAKIEVGFSGIKSHPSADLPSAHSSLPRAHSKTHLGNQKIHHNINEHQSTIVNVAVSSEAKHSTNGKTLMEDLRFKRKSRSYHQCCIGRSNDFRKE